MTTGKTTKCPLISHCHSISLRRPLLKQIKNSAVAHIVLDCSTDKIYDVLKQSQQIGMMSDYHSYLITSLVNTVKIEDSNISYKYNISFAQDLQTLDLEQFKYSGTNITAFRLVDPDNPMVRNAVTEWSQSELKTVRKSTQFVAHQNDSVINAETALMYDAVHLFGKALHDLDTSQQIDIQPLSCDGQDTWPHGYSLINYMKIVNTTSPS